MSNGEGSPQDAIRSLAVPETGAIYFGMRVDSSDDDLFQRTMLQKEFLQAAEWLTGLAHDAVVTNGDGEQQERNELRLFADYLKHITGRNGFEMPSHAAAMLDALKNKYWRPMCEECHRIVRERDNAAPDPMLRDYEPVFLPGFDFYCVDPFTGQRYCYHSFGLSLNGSEKPMQFGSQIKATPVFQCVGLAKR
jgi:hypothetical protein